MLRLLIDREFLRLDGAVTVMTDLGREALAELLADYADRLLGAALAAETPYFPTPAKALETVDITPSISPQKGVDAAIE